VRCHFAFLLRGFALRFGRYRQIHSKLLVRRRIHRAGTRPNAKKAISAAHRRLLGFAHLELDYAREARRSSKIDFRIHAIICV
jgi:hypothetical protein